MRRIVILTLLLLTATVGTAAADRYRGHRNHRGDHRGHVVRDHRVHRDHHRPVYRDHRSHRHVRHDYRYRDRRPVYSSNGHFVFNGGHRYSYRRPVISTRYYDYRVRPTILVENYDTVPGYIWVRGHWNWNGYEWVWIGGHYQVDSSYVYSEY